MFQLGCASRACFKNELLSGLTVALALVILLELQERLLSRIQLILEIVLVVILFTLIFWGWIIGYLKVG